jgi:hypothetical protein
MEPDISAIQPPTTDELERERIRRRLEEFTTANPTPSGAIPRSPASGQGKRRARPMLKPRLPR